MHSENFYIELMQDKPRSYLTSIISIFEIKRKLTRDKIDKNKIKTVMDFIKGRSIIIRLNQDIMEEAVKISVEKDIPAIDSLIYTSAQKNKVIIITGDNDFRKLSGVKIIQ